MAAVPGYPHLRYVGAALAPAEQQDKPAFLAALDAVGAALGRVIDIFSGSGGPSVRGGGGFVGDPHDLRIAADATIGGVPIGNYPGAVAAIHAQGLRSGATDFYYQGRRDPAHVDAVNLTDGGGGNPTATPTIKSADDYWYAVETALGIPHDRTNHAFLVAWANAEGTSAKNNPLATTLKKPGSTGLSGNPDGVQEYPTPELGVQATADTIRNYPSILAALKRGASFAGVSSPAVARELNIWSGHRSAGAKMTDYVKNVLLGFQGNPSGQGASDWLSYDLGNAATDAKKLVDKVTPAWVKGLGDVLGKVLDPHTWWRVGLMISGAVLVLAGLVFMAKSAGVAVPVPVP